MFFGLGLFLIAELKVLEEAACRGSLGREQVDLEVGEGLLLGFLVFCLNFEALAVHLRVQRDLHDEEIE